MTSKQNHQLLYRSLAQLSPQAFSHPVWINFLAAGMQGPPNFIEDLLFSAEQLKNEGDVVCACQVLLLCAVALDRLSDHATALISAQKAGALAKYHGLSKVSWWAIWGMSSLRARHGDYRQAAEHLGQLQIELSEQEEWLLSSIITMLKATLLNQIGADSSPAVGAESRLNVALEWLHRWGEPPRIIEATCNGAIRSNLGDSHSISKNSSFFSVQSLYWLWRRLIEHVTSNKFGLAQSEGNGHSTLPFASATRYNGRSSPSGPMSGNNGYALPSLTPMLTDDERVLSSSVTTIQNSERALPLPDPLATAGPPAPVTAPAAQSKATPSLVIYTLGTFRVYQNDRQVEKWHGNKGKLIFKYMVTHRQHFIHREILMDMFWSEADPESARRNLYQAIYKLRQILQTDLSEFSYILFEDSCYGLNPELELWVDSEAFMERYQAGQQLEDKGQMHEAIKAYELAEGLYKGDFLAEDIYEDWPATQRENLKHIYLDILDRLSQYYFDRKQFVMSIAFCQKILREDNCREDAHRRLMRCYHYQGQRHLALRQYHLCVETLKQELEVPPMPATVELHRQIQNNGPQFLEG